MDNEPVKNKELEIKITRRNLLHWTLEGSIYFVTFRLKDGIMSFRERQVVYDHIREGDKKFYNLIALTIMLDHVHMILKPLPNYTLSRIMKGVKGVSARLINELRCSRGTLWQEESYDRIIRDLGELHQKVNYMYYNPVRAGLVENPDEYQYWYFDEDWSVE